MIRRRGDTPPEPFDALDTGRDHITSPDMKNDGPRNHPTKNDARTAATPSTVPEDSAMSVTNPTIPAPKGFTLLDPTDPESGWGADDLDVGLEYTIAWSPEHGVEVYAGIERVGSADIVSAINDLIACYVGVRNAEAEHAANVRAVELELAQRDTN